MQVFSPGKLKEFCRYHAELFYIYSGSRTFLVPRVYMLILVHGNKTGPAPFPIASLSVNADSDSGV